MSKMTIELQRINYIITDKINNIICRIQHSTRCKIFRVNRFSEMDTLNIFHPRRKRFFTED